MQGFSLLVDKYNGLSTTSAQLKRDVSRIEGDIHSREQVLKAKYHELQNIHNTSILIRKLRQFLHIKIQIDNLIKASMRTGGSVGNSDAQDGENVVAAYTGTTNSVSVIAQLGIRQLGSISKLIHEAETCLGVDGLAGLEGIEMSLASNPHSNSILSIHLVQKGYKTIQAYASELRIYTHASLLTSIREKNQSNIAACLQVSY